MWWARPRKHMLGHVISHVSKSLTKTALPSQYLLGLTNTESEANPMNDLMMRRAGFSMFHII